MPFILKLRTEPADPLPMELKKGKGEKGEKKGMHLAFHCFLLEIEGDDYLYSFCLTL